MISLPAVNAHSVGDGGEENFGRFVLAFGATNPSKNMTLLRAVGELLGQYYTDPVLVVVGVEVGAAKWGPAVIAIPGVSDDALAHLMMLARAVLVPSLFEGFGYPVVEAMTMAKPVLVLDAAWSAELVGDAKCRLPNVPTVWVSEIRRLLAGPVASRGVGLPECLKGRTPEEFAREMFNALCGLEL
jgi:glycosyltransferase involved in cell wall biosynthesis